MLDNATRWIKQNDIRLRSAHVLRIERDQILSDLHRFQGTSPSFGVARQNFL
jgi:hypothetical protein